MKILRAYAYGWKLVFRMPGLLLFIYLAQLAFAILVALPLKTLLDSIAGQRTFAGKTFEDLDFTVISEIINQYGDFMPAYLGQGMITLIIFILFYLFLTGGILVILLRENRRFSKVRFWVGSGRFFGKLLGSFLFFSFLHGLVIGIFLVIFSLRAGNILDMESDQWILKWTAWMIPLLFALELIIALIHDHVKIAIAQDPAMGLLQIIRKRSGWVAGHFMDAFGLYVLVFLSGAILILAGRFAGSLLPDGTFSGVLAGLLISQFFILGRIALQLVNFASIAGLYREISEKRNMP